MMSEDHVPDLELLESVLNNTASSIMLLKPVKNKQNEIIDFEYLYTNSQTLKSVDREKLKGKYFLQEFPKLKNSSLLNAYIQVMETDNSYQDEVNITPYGIPVWAQVYARKTGGNLLVTYFDISERKKAEQENKEQAHFIRSVHDISPDIVTVIELPSRKIVYSNRDVMTKLGFDAKEIIEMSFTDRMKLVHPDDVAAVASYYERFNTLKDDEENTLEYRLKNKDGDWLTMILRSKVFKKDPQGNVTQILTFGSDITERKKTELAIREQESLVRHITEIVPDIINIVELPSRKIVWSNCDQFALFGFDYEEIMRMTTEERRSLIHPEDYPPLNAFYNSFNASTAADETHLAKYRGRNKNGDWVTVSIRGRVFKRHTSGSVKTILVIVQNITEKENAEQEVLKLKDEIAQRAEDKYRTLFQSIDEGYLIADVIFNKNNQAVDILFIEANPAAIRMAGRDFTNLRMREINPDYEEYWYDLYGRVVLTGEPIRMEQYAEPHKRWFDFHISKVEGPISHRVAVVFQDITERKQREKQQQFLIKISDALRAEPDADAIANRAIRMVAEHLQLDRCYVGIALLDENRGIFPYQIGNDRVTPMPEEGVSLSDFPEALRKTFDETLVITDFQNTVGLTETEKQNFAALGFGAMVVANVRKEEKNPYWSINAVSAIPRRWTDSEIQLVEEVTERTWAAVERARAEVVLRKSEQELQKNQKILADKLVETQLLQKISVRILEGGDIQALYNAIVDSAIELMHSDAGSMQILKPRTGKLQLLASRGFHPEAVKHWQVVNANDATICGQVIQNNKRITIRDVTDPLVEMDEENLAIFRLCNIRGIQSTPLITNSGKTVGMISTHWQKPYSPSALELELLDIISVQAADLIERSREEDILRRSKQRLKDQNEILENRVLQRTQEMVDLKLKQEKERLNAIFLAQEQERTRIGEGLHNSVAQLLFAAQAKFQMITPTGKKEEQAFTSALSILGDAISDTRNISFELMPPVLRDFGLKAAIQRFIDKITNENIHISLSVDLTQRLSETLEICIYRIVQEILSNMRKHADATSAMIDISETPDSILLRTTDNGKGFIIGDVMKLQKGIGLQTIENRVKLLDGKISICSQPGKGTEIEMQIPYKRERGGKSKHVMR